MSKYKILSDFKKYENTKLPLYPMLLPWPRNMLFLLELKIALMARDRKAQSICFQMLINPVTDVRQITESIKNYIDTPMWNSILNRKMWKLYLKDGVHCNREYASPIEAISLENLPDSYIEFYKTIGTVHGFDIAEKSEIVRQSVAKRIIALKKAFNCLDNLHY